MTLYYLKGSNLHQQMERPRPERPKPNIQNWLRKINEWEMLVLSWDNQAAKLSFFPARQDLIDLLGEGAKDLQDGIDFSFQKQVMGGDVLSCNGVWLDVEDFPNDLISQRVIAIPVTSQISAREQVVIELRELKQANQLLRSCYVIAERNGRDTNWEGVRQQLKIVLSLQHKFLYPSQYPPEIRSGDVFLHTTTGKCYECMGTDHKLLWVEKDNELKSLETGDCVLVKEGASVLSFIKTIRESFNGSIDVYTNGSCYQFYKILKLVFPSANAYYNSDHVITEINGAFYDIYGLVEKCNHLLMDEHYPNSAVKSCKYSQPSTEAREDECDHKGADGFNIFSYRNEGERLFAKCKRCKTEIEVLGEQAPSRPVLTEELAEIERLKNEVKRVKIQRNDYEQRLLKSERRIGELMAAGREVKTLVNAIMKTNTTTPETTVFHRIHLYCSKIKTIITKS